MGSLELLLCLNNEISVEGICLAAHGARRAQPVAHDPSRREWKLSATESVWPEFDVLLPVDDVVTFNGCRYHNVELYRLAAWTTHRNGARAFDRIYGAAADPQAAVSRLADILGATAAGSTVTHQRVTIDVRRDDAATWPVRIAGYRVTGLDEERMTHGQANRVTAFGQTIELSCQRLS